MLSAIYRPTQEPAISDDTPDGDVVECSPVLTFHGFTLDPSIDNTYVQTSIHMYYL